MIETGQEVKKQRSIDIVFEKYEDGFDNAVRGSDNDDEMGLDIRPVRETLVSEGLAVVETVYDCDRISLRLNSEKDKDLLQKVQAKRDSL